MGWRGRGEKDADEVFDDSRRAVERDLCGAQHENAVNSLMLTQ